MSMSLNLVDPFPMTRSKRHQENELRDLRTDISIAELILLVSFTTSFTTCHWKGTYEIEIGQVAFGMPVKCFREIYLPVREHT